jgi:uncharacterized protein YkwD
VRGHRGPRRVRTVLGILGALVLAGLIAAGGAVSVLAVANASGATGRNSDATVKAADTPGSASTVIAPSYLPDSSASTSPSPSAVSASPSPSASRAMTAPSPKASRPVPLKTTKAPTTTTTSSGSAAQQVVDQINQARAAAGVAALSMSSALVASAHAHNLAMADGCGLSHQCDGEDSLGDRISAQGVDWSSVAENIGEGGPVSSSAADQAKMAVSLTAGMLAETPPDDGHRKNILNGSLHHIGIDVIRDSSGTIWLTQDFSN